MNDPIQTALAAFEAAISAADPEVAVAHALPGMDLVPDDGGRLVIVALGKAAPAMADAAVAALPSADTLIVTAPGTDPGASGAKLMYGSHPVPDATSQAAGEALLGHVAGLTTADRVLALISGGGSALAVAPIPGVSLQDKADLNAALLASGLDIVAMNLIRQQASRLKGGGLAAAAAPAPVTALILSDVIGDDLSAVASGPTTPPVGTTAEARKTAQAAGIWQALPASIQAALSTNTDPSDAAATNILVGSNSQSVTAASKALGDLRRLPAPLVGDVTDAAAELLEQARNGSFVTGGETTVRLTGSGKGGRNQDLALRFALLAEEQGLPGDWVFLSGGTDGRDGPTDAAGAVVTPQTLGAIRAKGLDPAAHLSNNDAYPALDAAGALIKRPPSGTNVADIQIFLGVSSG